MTALEMKVTLLHTKPPVWRRLIVPDNFTLAQLHELLQAAMGWFNSHLHEFTIDGERFGDPETDFDGTGDFANEKKARLAGVLGEVGAKARYTYDFGDDWEHSILIEKTFVPDAAAQIPVCTAGKRSCPPEDCGGPFGYPEFLKKIGDPSHEEHAEMLEWVGGSFDPEAFSLEDVNQEIAAVFPPKAKGKRKALKEAD